MNKKFILVLLLISSALVAETKMEYQINLVGMNMDYREYDKSGQILDSEKSSLSEMSGAEIIYNYFLDTDSNINFKVMGLSGKSEYLGSYIGSGQPYGSVVSRTSNEIRDVVLGYSASNMSDIGVKMLGGLGVGYRFWQRELSASQIEQYEWYSIRGNVGVEYAYKNFVTAVKFEYQYGIRPRMTASGISSDFKLGAANIMEFSIPLHYNFTKEFGIFGEYVYQYQKIKESNVVYDNSGTGYYEPDSKAYNQYAKFGIVFKY